MSSEREKLRALWAEYLQNYPKDMPLARLENIYAEIVRMKLQGIATEMYNDIAKVINIKIDELRARKESNHAELQSNQSDVQT